MAAGSGDAESVAVLSPAADMGDVYGGGGGGGGQASSDGDVAVLRAPKEATESGVGAVAPEAGVEDDAAGTVPLSSPITSSVSGGADNGGGDGVREGIAEVAEAAVEAPELAPISPSVAAGLTPMLHGEYADPGEDEIMVKTEFVWADGANHDVRLSGAWNGWMPGTCVTGGEKRGGRWEGEGRGNAGGKWDGGERTRCLWKCAGDVLTWTLDQACHPSLSR